MFHGVCQVSVLTCTHCGDAAGATSQTHACNPARGADGAAPCSVWLHSPHHHVPGKLKKSLFQFINRVYKGRAQTQAPPANRNCTPESPTCGGDHKDQPKPECNERASLWGKPPHGSRYLLCQVSMLDSCRNLAYKLGV